MDRDAVIRALEEASRHKEPGLRILPFNAVHSLADRLGMPPLEIEIQALSADIVPERYVRNLDSISITGQKRLLESTVVQIGLGGLGGHLLEIFARAGIGLIRAFDGDVFEPTNLNRQFLSNEASIGRAKAESAQKRAMAVNSSVKLDIRKEFLDEAELGRRLQGCDLLVDALGDLAAREMLAAAARKANVPLVTAAVAGWTAWVSTVLTGDEDPSSFMRAAGPGEDAQNTLGVPAPAVTALAGIQAAECIRLLAGEPPALRGKILIMDLATMNFETVSLT